MKHRRPVIGLAAALSGLCILCSYACASEVHVFSVPAMRPVFNELGGQFERASGHSLVVRFEFVPVALKGIQTGARFDLAILEPYAIDDLIKQDKVVANTRKNIGYVGLGLGTRAGARKPDIASVDAFKRALLNAESISYQPDTGSGRHFTGLLQRLGIADDVEPKLKPKASGAAVQSVASGEAELVMISIPVLLTTQGVELVGPLPPELQTYIRFDGALGASAESPEAAEALLELLTSASSAQAFRSHGMEQGRP